MRPIRRPQSSLEAVLFIVLAACGPGGNGSPGAGGRASPGQGTIEPDRPVLHSTQPPVRPGLEVLLADSSHLVEGRRVGLVTNHTAIDRERIHAIDRLVEAPGVELVALFSPEHGIRGDAEGGVGIDSQEDARTGLPIHSLYGETRKPTPEMLEGIQVLLFDIQDVGARYYTYVSTMALAMEAAGEAEIPFIVLDRPNPIGGVAVQGSVLDPAFSTFVGLYPVPMRHGMTPGELARLYVGEFGLEVDLAVAPVDGWRRTMLFGDTGLPWVPPSPNMPSVESALHYPGTCLFEGTNISVGRGTELAFQILGAPWLDGNTLAAAIEAYQLPDLEIRPFSFTPENPGDGKYAGGEIHGIRLISRGPGYDPTVTALALLRETKRMSGDRWEWRQSHFDRLAGTDLLRIGIDRGHSMEALQEGWITALEAFNALRTEYLIYE